uniref:NADH-ubiquinone oxidoreductase chain 6 n=1 Tax=Scolytinae sp. BMNH 1039896 TaxID=1903768 RepID=A0A343A4Z9_9CUCU|nr:NADH dehydrogenase subunit 6 [Scolytinae sp. BMNH 1039896]
MTFSMSMLFIFLNHPLALGSILLLQSIMASINSGLMYTNFWLSYILFLIMVGGMLIMFMYMTSIASNEKFKMPKTKSLTMKTSIFMLIMILLILFMDPSIFPLTSELTLNSSINNNTLLLSLNKFFNWPYFILSITLMAYLLLTLIAIVKITGKNLSPMRQK